LIVANADRIIELLHEAKARPAGAERERFLAEACGDDAALKEQIASLLQADANEGDSDFLKNTLFLRPTAPVIEKPGDRIGRYKLLEQIGEGGCGVVYMAEQQEPVRRRVALKVIKLGMDTKQVVARFEAERQALAMMEHPNIAKVLDGGATDAGRPFFVMELVRGIKITDYCDQNNLSTHERLKLFIQVCQAIQHAHQKGIIHRDIKPSNILVTQHDAVAVPKVIDFGIAKATVGQLTDKTVFTAFAQFIGTPAYMSPEQAQMSGLDVDTRADIYSLGVLLYELLTGNTPFDAKELLAAGMDEMRRKIREDEPAKPSTCLSTMTAIDLTTVAKQRHAEAPKLIHLVRGDLDWLVMKCLEKDRTRRYETANGLAADIQRHLQNEPVVASPPSNLYRFQKMVRRNTLVFAAGAAVLLVLLAGIAASTWQAIRATRAEHEQARERGKAEANEKKAALEAAKNQQIAQFMKSMMGGVGPSVALGRDTTMLREILDRTARRLTDLKDQPGVEADLRSTLGKVYADLGEYTNALAMHREALALIKKLRGNEHPDVASSFYDLAHVLTRQGNHSEAESFFRKTLEMRRKLLGKDHLDVAECLRGMFNLFREDSRWPEAEIAARENLAILKKQMGDQHAKVGYTLHDLAFILRCQGKFAEAETRSREELTIWRKVYGDDHPNVGWALSDLASLLYEQGKLAESEPSIQEALAIERKRVANDPNNVTVALRRLPLTLNRLGKHDPAEELCREELALFRRVFGSNHPEVMNTLLGLAQILQNNGKFSEAEMRTREALAIQQKLSANDNLKLYSLNLLSDLLRAQNKLTEAETTAREKLALTRKMGNGHPRVTQAVQHLADVLGREGKYTEGATLLREDRRLYVANTGRNAASGRSMDRSRSGVPRIGRGATEAPRQRAFGPRSRPPWAGQGAQSQR
jgi:serine/threonine protein kinase/tetratricopeptide (TPR) repeat protein